MHMHVSFAMIDNWTHGYQLVCWLCHQ